MVMLSSALTDKDWVQVAVIRGRLKEIMNKKNLGFCARSRFKENLEGESASLYHLNREKKKANQKSVSKLSINGNDVENKEDIEEEIAGFFGALFKGYHRNIGETFPILTSF